MFLKPYRPSNQFKLLSILFSTHKSDIISINLSDLVTA